MRHEIAGEYRGDHISCKFGSHNLPRKKLILSLLKRLDSLKSFKNTLHLKKGKSDFVNIYLRN